MDRGETNQTHVTHKRHALLSECTVLTEEFTTVGKHFLLRCQSDEKVALPEKIKMARGTDVSLAVSLFISPVDAAQTPLGSTHIWKELSVGLIQYLE